MPLNLNNTEVTGVDLNNTEVSEVRLNGQSVFTPGPVPDTSNLVFHLDAAQESFANNESTTTITDFSSNGNDLSGDAVTFETNELNGLPTFRFFQDSLQNTNVNFSDPFTAAFVYEYDTTGEFYYYFGNAASTSEFYTASDTGEFVDRSHFVSGPTGSVAADVGFSPGVYQTTVYIIDAGNGIIRNNGTQIATGTVGTGPVGDVLSVGTAGGNTASGIQGYIAELLIYDNLTNISDLESYLSDKWATF